MVPKQDGCAVVASHNDSETLGFLQHVGCAILMLLLLLLLLCFPQPAYHLSQHLVHDL
jgi:hypothetical protein